MRLSEIEETKTEPSGKTMRLSEIKETAAPEGESDLYKKTYRALSEAKLPEGKTSVVGPMMAAGAGELARGAGALTQLVAPETGKKISDVGRAVVEATKERYPITGTIGQFGSYILPYGAAEKGIATVLPRTGTLGREAQIAGGAGAATGFALSEDDLRGRTINAALGGMLGMGATYGGALASKGYDWTKKTLTDAFGGDARRLSESLRSYSSMLTGSEARAAKKMADDIEREAATKVAGAERGAAKAGEAAATAERAAGRAERQAERAGKPMAGVSEQQIAGRYRPVGISEQDVGDRLRGYVTDTFKRLKQTRSANAEKIKGEAFSAAKTKEQAGGRIANTKAYQDLQNDVQKILRDEEGLVGAPGSTGTKLGELRNILKGTAVDEATGVVVSNDLSFQGMERLRRQLSDRAYGFPETGFDAIGQQEAGAFAKKIAAAMEEFSPGYKKFLDQYKKDSEPLQIFKTKVGKVFEEQLPGATGYAKVASQDIPKKVFANRESYQGLVEALGGNQQLAQAEARKYFANELNKLAGDTKKMEKFIIDNRNMLNLTGARDMAESYLARTSAFARRAGAAEARSAEELARAKDIEALSKQESAASRKEAERLRDVSTEFSKMESQMKAARTPDEIARLHDAAASRLFKEGKITQAQYDDMLAQGREVLQKVADKQQAIRSLLNLTWRSVGGGLIGAAAYGGVRYYGGQ